MPQLQEDEWPDDDEPTTVEREDGEDAAPEPLDDLRGELDSSRGDPADEPVKLPPIDRSGQGAGQS